MLRVYTDILCPWSWGEEGILRVLKYLYPDLKIEYIMGDLVDNYENFLPKNFAKLNSVELGNKILYDMYRAAATITRFPYFSDIPHLFSQDHKSSFPLNISFIAVRNIDEKKANTYLRLMREAMIYRDLNLYDEKVQSLLLEKIGIDEDEYRIELEFANEDFLQDRMKCFDDRIKKFPAFLVDSNRGRKILKGYQDLKTLSHFVEDDLKLKRRKVEAREETILDFISRFDGVLEEELRILFPDLTALEELKKKDVLTMEEVTGGRIFRLKNFSSTEIK
ncbi:MAG: DsbA family protein [Tissierellia bacterium]|nr:DsbA family protein [Tissierellia bacterium]